MQTQQQIGVKQSVNFTELYRLNEEFDPGSG